MRSAVLGHAAEYDCARLQNTAKTLTAADGWNLTPTLMLYMFLLIICEYENWSSSVEIMLINT